MLTESEVIRRAIESRLGDVYTALPGRVESYDPSSQTADVAPCVKRPVPTANGDIILEKMPIIPNVQILFPRGGAFTISWPIAKGDHVLLVFMTYAIGQWRKTGETSPPGDLRMHHLSNAIAIPILAPNAGALPESQAGDNAYIIAGPMIKLGAADATDFAAMSSKVNSNFNAITNLFSSWTPVPNDGGAALKTAATALSFDSVACSNVKVK